MKLEDYKTILYRQQDGSCVAEIPAIPGWYALMDTREAALAELSQVFTSCVRFVLTLFNPKPS